jgi:hypothetical protein
VTVGLRLPDPMMPSCAWRQKQRPDQAMVREILVVVPVLEAGRSTSVALSHAEKDHVGW